MNMTGSAQLRGRQAKTSQDEKRQGTKKEAGRMQEECADGAFINSLLSVVRNVSVCERKTA